MMTILHRMPARLALAVTSIAYAAIGVASLAPQTMRPTSGVVPGPVEHLAAYILLGLLSASTLRLRISTARLAVLNAIYAGILEVGQNAVPGRVPALLDFGASTLGSCLGIAAVVLFVRSRADKATT